MICDLKCILFFNKPEISYFLPIFCSDYKMINIVYCFIHKYESVYVLVINLHDLLTSYNIKKLLPWCIIIPIQFTYKYTRSYVSSKLALQNI